MKSRLGIDLGTNSLGWAVLEDDKIKNCGVLIFEQGIPIAKGEEASKSPAAERRAFRAARRLKYRRRLRKYHVLKLLIENNMCPLELHELKNWISHGVFPLDNKQFIAWLDSTRENNPYYFRAKAATEKVTPFELGRALFHIAIRRGFKSSRKDQSADEKTTSELKAKIDGLKNKLDASKQTLGQFLYEEYKKGSRLRNEIRCGRIAHYIPEFKRICDVQGLDPELINKFQTALFMQRPLRSQKHLAGKCPLEKNSTRCLVGHPLFERYRQLSFINTIKVTEEGFSDSRFLNEQERLALGSQFMYKAPTFKFERLKKYLTKKFFNEQNVEFNYRDDHTVGSSTLTYQLQQLLQCEDLFSWRHAYTDRRGGEKIMDLQTLFDGIKYFTEDYDEDDDDKAFKKFACERVGLSETAASELIKIKVPKGYARYSLKAIRKIIPFLKEGFIERHAVYLAKLPDLFGEERFAANKTDILADFRLCVKDYEWEKKNLTEREQKQCLSLSERFELVLEEKWKLSPADIALLYAFQEPSNYMDCSKDGRLPRVELGMIYNPMVHRSLTVLRHLVNSLRADDQIGSDTEIHIELARDVNDKNSRMAYYEYQKQNEEKRKKAIDAFSEHNIIPSEEQILRWRLWKEQNCKCLYTGRNIEDTEIFCPLEHTTVDIEHTIPRSLGGDNSMENLTLCDSRYNRNIKIGKLPIECPNYQEASGKYDKSIIDNLKLTGFYKILEKAEKNYDDLCNNAKSASFANREVARQRMLLQRFELKYWRNKIKSFEINRDNLGDFSRRQLAATGVMSRHALQFLKSVYSKVYANSGSVTAFARQSWGLQKQYESKDRTDHLHHVLDAIVIAALNKSTLQLICNAFHNNDQCKYNAALKISYPWDNFPEDVNKAVESIMVNHLIRHNEMKQTKKKNVHLAAPLQLSDGRVLKTVSGAGDTVRGALHDLTYYGCIMDQSGNQQFVLRVPFSSDSFKSMAAFDAIVDKGVREAVKAQMQELLDGGHNFKDAMSHDFRMRTKSGEFDGPVIRHVRVFRKEKNLIKVKKQTNLSDKDYKQYYYAATAKDSNFMVALYRPDGIEPNVKKYNYDIISLWNWARDHRQPNYIPPSQRTNQGHFVGIINPGVLVLFYKDSPEELRTMSLAELQKRLYKVTEFSKEEGRIRICMRWHREARAKTDAEKSMKNDYGFETSSKLPFDVTYPLLRLSPNNYQNHTLFEGIDFDLTIDGKIKFKE